MSPLNQSIFACIIITIIFLLTPNTTNAQYLVASPKTYVPGNYYVTFNTTTPVNLGHSSNNQAAYKDSTGFTLLRSAIQNGTYYFRISSVSSSAGNYVIFNAASNFLISYKIGESFSSFSTSSYTSYSLSAYGIERLYSSSFRAGEKYSLQIKSDRSASVRIAYTFDIDTTPSYSSYSISSSKTASISFTAPYSSSYYATLYLYIQCNNGASDCGSINIDNTRSGDDAGMIIGIVIGVFILFIIISVAISIPSVIAAKKRRMMALAAVTAAKHDMTTSTVGQPTMPPGAYQPMVTTTTTNVSTMPPGAYYSQPQATMPPGAYQPIPSTTSMPPGAYQPVQNQAYQPYVDPQAQYYGQPQGYQPPQYGNQPMPAYNPNADRV